MGTVKYWGTKALYFSQDNKVAVGVAVVIGLITMVGLCYMACCRGGDDDDDDLPPTPAGRNRAAPEPESESDEEPIKEVTKAVPKEKPKGGAKKRTPKAS